MTPNERDGSVATHPSKTCFEKTGIGAIDPERRDGIAIESSRR